MRDQHDGTKPDRPQAAGESIASSLLVRLQQRDEESWRQLQFLYGPVINGWLRWSRVPESDVDDLQQEIMRQVATHVAQFDRSEAGGTFRGWLWTITHNKIRDRARRLTRLPIGEGGTDAMLRINSVPAPDEEASALIPPENDDESRGLVSRAIELVRQEVKDHTWQACWLTTVEGLTAAEAGERLGIGVGSVYTAKSRVLARLREILGEDCERLLGGG